jgi:hypothetical protein
MGFGDVCHGSCHDPEGASGSYCSPIAPGPVTTTVSLQEVPAERRPSRWSSGQTSSPSCSGARPPGPLGGWHVRRGSRCGRHQPWPDRLDPSRGRGVGRVTQA